MKHSKDNNYERVVAHWEDRHRKYIYLFPFHAKVVRDRVRVAVLFDILSDKIKQ